MIKYFIRWRVGWWLLHIIMILLILGLGATINFN